MADQADNAPPEEKPQSLMQAAGLSYLDEIFGNLNKQPDQDVNAEEESDDGQNGTDEVNESNQDHAEDDTTGEEAGQNGDDSLGLPGGESDDKPGDGQKKDRVRITDEQDEETRKQIDDLKRQVEELKSKSGPQQQAQEDDGIDTEGLTEEEIEELEVYKFAGSKADQYKDHPKKLAEWYKEAKEYAQEQDEYWDPDSDNEYQSILKKKPKLSPRDAKKFSIGYHTQELLEQQTQPLKDENEKLKEELRRLKSAPDVQKGVTEFKDQFKKLTGDDLTVGEEEIADTILKDGEKYVADYLDLYYGNVKFDTKNERHTAINQFVVEMADQFKAQGGQHRVRDGKQFATPYEFMQLQDQDQGKADQYWTFGPNDVVKIIANRANIIAKEQMKSEREKLQKLEQRRGGNQNPGAIPGKSGQSSDDTGQSVSHRSTTTPSPGAGQKGANTEKITGKSVLKSIFEVLES